MPPPLALLLTVVFVLYLFDRDSRESPRASGALWIPCLWFMIVGSRNVSQWISPGWPAQSADQVLDGSPTDRLVYFGLIAAAGVVLWKRGVPWRTLYGQNVWLTVFFLYCAVSIAWSDFPFVALKRWFKGLGDPMMALVILSEPAPARAVEMVLKRCAFILLPFSILFIKYFPALGRQYDEWSGVGFFTGVTTSKNLLGYLLLVFGLFFLCLLAARWAKSRGAFKRKYVVIPIVVLGMIAWLASVADSKTSLMSLLLGSLVAMALASRGVRRNFGGYLIVTLLVLGVLNWSVGLTESLIAGAGRDATLTGRTELWGSVLEMTVNRWLGAGYQSFWLGDRLKALWAIYYFKPTQAHNGYLEMYLNLGWIGVCLLCGTLWASYSTAQKRLRLAVEPSGSEPAEVAFATFGLAFVTTYLVYNVTEATFYPLNFLFVIFLLVAIDYPKSHPHQRHVVRSTSTPR